MGNAMSESIREIRAAGARPRHYVITHHPDRVRRMLNLLQLAGVAAAALAIAIGILTHWFLHSWASFGYAVALLPSMAWLWLSITRSEVSRALDAIRELRRH